MGYHVTGFISAVIFLLTIGGLVSQLRLIWLRRERGRAGVLEGEAATAVLSLNQFVSSFLAFYSFFLYGACLPRFNHYLVWPRLAAAVLTLAVLWEMVRDRRDVRSIAACAGCVLVQGATPWLLLWRPAVAASGRWVSQGLVVVVTVILAQGYLDQVWRIRRTGRTGAVSMRMHQFYLLKDLSTIAFAWAMGLAAGWPLMLLSSVSGAIKLTTLWHFRWVRLSPVAARLRAGGFTERQPAGAVWE